MNKLYLPSLLLLLLINLLQAQTYDPSFSLSLLSEGPFPVYAIGKQSDGKVIVGAHSAFINGKLKKGIFRLNADLTLDESFAASVQSTFSFGPGVTSKTSKIAITENGKILIGGSFNKVNEENIRGFVQLNSDGSTDKSFKIGSGFNGDVASFGIDKNGKIVLIGTFTEYNGSSLKGIVRLNADGSIDNTFTPEISINIISKGSVFIRDDGRIILHGQGFSVFHKNGESLPSILILNSNGSLDTNFNYTQNDVVRSILPLEDNKLITFPLGDPIKRLNPNGTIDQSYTPIDHYVITSIRLMNGKIIGTAGSELLQLNSDGTFDAVSPYNFVGDTPLCMEQLNDGRVLIGGFESFKVFMDFNETPSETGLVFTQAARIRDILVSDDENIIFGGTIHSINTFSCKHLLKINGEGVINTNFNFFSDSPVNKIRKKGNGQFYVALSNIEEGGIALINADGSKAPEFNVGTGFDGVVNDIAVLESSKILVGGQFESFNGVTVDKIVRLNSDGSLDDTFQSQSDFIYINTLVVTENNKILAGGLAESGKVLTRFNEDGSLDESFNIGTGSSGSVATIVLDENKNIFVGGSIYEFNGVTDYNSLVKLLPDGSIDPSFNLTGIAGTVTAIAFLNKEKILLAGGFDYGRTRGPGIARINSNGTVDSSFVHDFEMPATIFSIAINNGDVYVGGSFYQSFSPLTTGIVKLVEIPTAINSIAKELTAKVHPNPLNSTASLKISNSYHGTLVITISDLSGKRVFHETILKDPNETDKSLETAHLTPGLYILQVKGTNFIHHERILKK